MARKFSGGIAYKILIAIVLAISSIALYVGVLFSIYKTREIERCFEKLTDSTTFGGELTFEGDKSTSFCFSPQIREYNALITILFAIGFGLPIVFFGSAKYLFPEQKK